MNDQLPLPMPTALAAREALFLSPDRRVLTSSRAVAGRFSKRHNDVLRDIKKLLAQMPDPGFSLRNFAQSTYLNMRGREHPEYLLTHDGFALLVMGFTGREALAWKVAFLQAFNALEAELQAATARYAAALDMVRPCLRPVAEGKQAGLNRAAIGAPLGRTPASITYHTGQARRFGLLPARVAPTPTTATLH